VDETIRLLYVAMTRAEEYVILTGQDDENTPLDFSSPEEKIKQLNSFFKQIKYALEVKKADASLIEFLNADDLDDFEVKDSKQGPMNIEESGLDRRIRYASRVKPSSQVSATRYIKHEKCPRRFYIENVLRVSGDNYLDAEISDEIVEERAGASGAEVGTAVHSVIEALNDNQPEYEALKKAIDMFDYIPEIEDKVKRYINDNYHNEDLNIAEISSHFYINYSYLCYLFKREALNTVNEYIFEVRLKKAKALFDGGNKLVSDVAVKVGYSDANYFGKCFKKRYGVSPSKYIENI
jgi:YesN/AraC family two-component response regulator